jgi:hypothetical protein
MTRLCSARRHDRAIGVARILHDEVGGSPPRRDTRFVGNIGAAFSQGAFGAQGRSSEARIIGNSHVPKDLPKEGRRKISRGQAREVSIGTERPFNVCVQTLFQTL